MWFLRLYVFSGSCSDCLLVCSFSQGLSDYRSRIPSDDRLFLLDNEPSARVAARLFRGTLSLPDALSKCRAFEVSRLRDLSPILPKKIKRKNKKYKTSVSLSKQIVKRTHTFSFSWAQHFLLILARRFLTGQHCNAASVGWVTRDAFNLTLQMFWSIWLINQNKEFYKLTQRML